MIGFWIFSVLTSFILLRYSPAPLGMIVRLMAMIGIIIHELCHLLMCLIINSPVDEIKLLERIKVADQNGRNRFEYGGRVMLRENSELTFLQALLIGLAPLMVSFWIFFFLLDLIFTVPEISTIVFFLILILMISIVLAAAPSAVDVLNIPSAFKQNPSYSLYQLGLLLLSILSVWLLSFSLSAIGFHEIIYYVLIGLFYSGFKYGINVIQSLSRNSQRLDNKFPIYKSNKGVIQSKYKTRREISEFSKKYKR